MTPGSPRPQALGRRLASEKLEAVYCSPQTRAIQTATPIAEALGLPIETLDGLRELDIGELDGLQAHDLRDRYSHILDQWRTDVGALTMPGGESIVGLQQRTWEAILKIRESHEEDITVAAVSHNFRHSEHPHQGLGDGPAKLPAHQAGSGRHQRGRLQERRALPQVPQ